MFLDFLAFLVVAGLALPQVDIATLLTFMEYLQTNQTKVLTITNYISVLRSSFIRYGLPVTPFEDHKISMFVKALKINRPLSVEITPVFSVDVLLNIINISETLESPHVHCIVFDSLFLFLEIV